ncbi:Protein TAR1 [Capsicum baccatum]|uniref:Protein TAR1 n=1 Tax=Capsicum baccatum TaxID=33114 RepID=A0A2G2UY50_CAPBA|nr:Protein TAR1 [Capsicum baccatum]
MLMYTDERFASQYRCGPPPEFPLASPRSGIVHHLSGPDMYAHTRTLLRRSRSVGGAPLGGSHQSASLRLRVYSPVDSHTCQTPWSMFQDGSNGEPTGQHPERADAEARRRCALPSTIEETAFHERIEIPGFRRPPIYASPRTGSINVPARRRSTYDRGASPAPIRFPPDNFKHSLTLFSKSFSSFPRGICLLSISRPYLDLDGIHRPIWAAFPNNPTHRQRLVVRQGPSTTGLSPSPAPPSRGLRPGPPLRTLLQTTIRTTEPPDSKAGLFPIRSPLLRESFALVPWCLGATVPRCLGAMAPCCLCAMVPRCYGATVHWCHGALVPWCHGATVPWHHGSALVRWCHGATAPWRHGALVPWCRGAMVPRCLDSLVPWFLGALVPRRHGAKLPWCHGACMPRCHGATVPVCHGAMVPLCLSATMLWCHGACVPSCFGAMVHV